MAIARPPNGEAGCLAKLQDVVQGSPGAPKPTGAGLSVTHTTLGRELDALYDDVAHKAGWILGSVNSGESYVMGVLPAGIDGNGREN